MDLGIFETYHSLVEKLDFKDRLILFSLLGDVMERFRKTSDFGLKEEFLERAKPFLILVGMWERIEEDEEEKIVLESFLTDLNISYSYSFIISYRRSLMLCIISV